MGQNTIDTFTETLPKMMHLLADMKMMPDADVPWCIQMENMVLAKANQPIQDMKNSGALPGGAGAPGPGMQGMQQFQPGQQMPQMPQMPQGQQGMPTGMPGSGGGNPNVPFPHLARMSGGMQPGANAPSPDELARLLGAGATNNGG